MVFREACEALDQVDMTRPRGAGVREEDVVATEEPPLERRPSFDPRVTVDDVARRPVDQHLRHPADLTKGTSQRPLLLLGMRPPVPWVGHELGGCHVGVAHDPVAPGGGGSGERLGRHLRHRPCIVA
jgi:hypothetical protein